MHQHTGRTRALLLAAAMSLALFGCSTGNDTSDDGQSTNGGGSTDTNDNDNETSVRLGSFDDDGDFETGMISADNRTPSTGQSTTLSIRLLDDNGDPVGDGANVFFSSPCAEAGDADIDPRVVDNTDGVVTTTYTPLGCDTRDTVTARTSINGQTLEADVTLEPTAPPAAALAFVSSSNAQIGIRGTGILPPQSRLTFRVTDNDGQPVPNQPVEFTPGTDVGGISISPRQARTNADGEATTTVTSGTQATSVQVRASTIGADGRTVSGQSRTLAVTTGLADQNSFSVSAERTSIEGYELDGASTGITVRAADRFNNPVPDGTTVTFTTEGGSIPGQCETSGGSCSVEFVSQNPRPGNGRVTILATATGEESFTDSAPSNGRFDEGEKYRDLREAFLDENEDGSRQTNEPYIDFNNDGSYDNASGKYNGLLCNAGDKCGQSDTITVRGDVVIVLSGSQLLIDLPDDISLDDGPVDLIAFIRDRRGQQPPAGTVISAETTQGSIEGPAEYTVPNNPDDRAYRAEFRLEPGGTPGNGIFRVTVTTPNGTISRETAPVTQSDDS